MSTTPQYDRNSGSRAPGPIHRRSAPWTGPVKSKSPRSAKPITYAGIARGRTRAHSSTALGGAIGDDQPGEAGAHDERSGAHAGHQRQRVADQLRELRAPEMSPDLVRRIRERREDGQARHRDQRGDGDGRDRPRPGWTAHDAPFLAPEFE